MTTERESFDDYLPPASRLLARRIGLPALLALSKWRGGTTVYVPTPNRLALDHQLVGVVGRAAAMELARHYGGGIVEVPRCVAHASQLLRKDICRRRAEGESEAQVARSVGVTGRWVRYLVARDRKEAAEARQPDLFD